MGAGAKYLRDYTTGSPFSGRRLAASSAVGAFVGATVGGLLPEGYGLRDSTLLMAGFSATLFLQLAEDRVAAAFRLLGIGASPEAKK